MCSAQSEFFVSSYGIREGILYEQMPPALRARDPLIEACSFMEKQSAAHPRFRRAALRVFLRPLFRSARPGAAAADPRRLPAA